MTPAGPDVDEPVGRSRRARTAGSSRLGPVERVLFYGKSMSRTRCTGALVDALREHGVQVRWRNLTTWRRWFGPNLAIKLARAEFQRYRPDTVFVFFRDLPALLAAEFRRDARIVIWCEEALESLDGSIVDYFELADLVCMSNPARFHWLRERGLENMAFLMSGFTPRFHHPARPQPKRRDVAFIGGPGRKGQRASFLARIAEHFDTEVFGMHWDRWQHLIGRLRVRGAVKNRDYARVCGTSRIVLGINEVNDDVYYFSNRTFLTLACGGFHLTHYVPKLENVFADGEHLAWYHDEDDAMEQIAHWLERPDERAEIAASGHAEVMEHHRYFHRVARILHWLQTGLPNASSFAVDGLEGGFTRSEPTRASKPPIPRGR
ncbi:MAG: glycosyltransferase family 1 protein [Planctomycetes bacterium]|nr:glycosyltransferase family 1 protein [Planctomycetota bacterium]